MAIWSHEILVFSESVSSLQCKKLKINHTYCLRLRFMKFWECKNSKKSVLWISRSSLIAVFPPFWIFGLWYFGFFLSLGSTFKCQKWKNFFLHTITTYPILPHSYRYWFLNDVIACILSPISQKRKPRRL